MQRELIMTIGLGVMGWPMAMNLRSKVDTAITVYICDVNAAAIDRFKAELGGKGPIEVVQNAFEAVKSAVGCNCTHRFVASD